MKKQITKHQHFVPKMYLKNFAIKTKAKNPIYVCHVINKDDNIIQKQQTSNICFVDYLYELPGWAIRNDINQIEDWLSTLETKHEPRLTHFVSNPFSCIHDNKIDDAYRRMLFVLFASLLLRHPHALSVAGNVASECGADIAEHQKPLLGLVILRYYLAQISTSYYLNYDAIILHNTTLIPFITSDMPVGFTPPWANAMYKLFYLPLSPKYALLLLPRCTSIFPAIQTRMSAWHDAIIPCAEDIVKQCNEMQYFLCKTYAIATNYSEMSAGLTGVLRHCKPKIRN